MTSAVTPHAPAGLRCSDADRERTSERLRLAAGEGYLAMDELDERLAAVYAARYRHELDTLVEDLPEPAAASASSGWRAVWLMTINQLRADLALLFGRSGTGWNRRRIIIALLSALVVAVVVIGAFRGFGGGGFDNRGFGPGGFGGPHGRFRH